jgi:hypothetical protein
MYENLPLYDCHKKVRAAKIIDRDNDVLVLEIPGIESATFKVTVDDEYLSRCPKLAVGGFFVVYQEGDNYASYSPAGPFEGGYTLAGDGVEKEKYTLNEWMSACTSMPTSINLRLQAMNIALQMLRDDSASARVIKTDEGVKDKAPYGGLVPLAEIIHGWLVKG